MIAQADLDKALAALDRALDDRPDKVYGDLAEAVRCVAALRDRLIEDARAGTGNRARLDRVNAVLSQIVGAEYPLAGVRRERVKKARAELTTV